MERPLAHAPVTGQVVGRISEKDPGDVANAEALGQLFCKAVWLTERPNRESKEPLAAAFRARPASRSVSHVVVGIQSQSALHDILWADAPVT